MQSQTIQRQYDEVIAPHYDLDPQSVIRPSLDRAAAQIQGQNLFRAGARLRVLDLGIGTGLFLAERGDGQMGNAVRFVAEVLSGVPSIVIGIVAYGLVVVPMHRFSAVAGAVALSLLMIPTLARTTEEMVRLVPGSLREAALAMGVPQWKTSLRVVLRTALGGIVTAALLSISRAAGETAPLLFTSLNNQYWNLQPDLPTASLTVQIFNYAISPYEDWHRKAWSAALVLLMFVMITNLTSRFLARNRLQRAR